MKETIISILIVFYVIQSSLWRRKNTLNFIFLTCNKYDFISACSLTNLICISETEENLKTKQEC